MKNFEFCYWLQGFFELTQEDPYASISVEQVKIIKNHIDLVRKVEGKLLEFPSWLEGFLDNSDGQGVKVDVIRTKLNDCFEHVIDLTYEKGIPGLKEKLGKIHSGGVHDSGLDNRPLRC